MIVQALKLKTVHEYRHTEIRRFLSGSEFIEQSSNKHSRCRKGKKVHCFLRQSLMNLIKKGITLCISWQKKKKGGGRGIKLWAGFHDPGVSFWSSIPISGPTGCNYKNESRFLKYFLSNRQSQTNYEVQLIEQAKYYD